jgi:hypothetical protein
MTNLSSFGATLFKAKLLPNLAPRSSRRSKVEIDEQHVAHSKMHPASDTRPGFGSLIPGGPSRVGAVVQEPLDQRFVLQDPAENSQVSGTDMILKDAEPHPSRRAQEIQPDY